MTNVRRWAWCLVGAVATAAVVVPALSAHAITGGQTAAPGQFPYFAWVTHSGDPICGGTVIESSWVLTAAHCVDNFPPPELVLAEIRGSLWRAVEIKIHPQWNGEQRYGHDLAIIRLAEGATSGVDPYGWATRGIPRSTPPAPPR